MRSRAGQELTANVLWQQDVWRMIKQRGKSADLRGMSG